MSNTNTNKKIMTLRNAPGMMASVRHQISGENPNLSQYHKNNKGLSEHPPLLTDGVHSDVHLGKREAGTDGCQGSRIQTKQTRHNHPKDTLPLNANDEKKTKQEVIRALNGVSKSESMISMATSILNWSTRAMRNEIYTYYYIHCHTSSLDPLSLAKWFLSKIEEYNSSIHERDHDTSANVQAPLAHSKDAAEDFLKWLKIPSRTLNDPDTATNKLAATSEKSVAEAAIEISLASGTAESNMTAKRKSALHDKVPGGGDGSEVGGDDGGGGDGGRGGGGAHKVMRGQSCHGGMKEEAGPRSDACVGALSSVSACGVRPQAYRVVERALPH